VIKPLEDLNGKKTALEDKSNSKKYYGIMTPKGNTICVEGDKHRAWDSFFNINPHRLTIYEAIKAYEAIGYYCIMFELKEVKE